MKYPKRTIEMTRQHEGLNDPSRKQRDPSSSASPSCITHPRPRRGGVAHNSCRMQAHQFSQLFLFLSPLIKQKPLALHLCPACRNTCRTYSFVLLPTCSQRPVYPQVQRLLLYVSTEEARHVLPKRAKAHVTITSDTVGLAVTDGA